MAAESSSPSPALQIFISYSSNPDSTSWTQEFQGALRNMLYETMQATVTVRTDMKEMPSERTRHEIANAIDNSNIFIAVIDPNYLQSKWTEFELNRFIEKNGIDFVFPVIRLLVDPDKEFSGISQILKPRPIHSFYEIDKDNTPRPLRFNSLEFEHAIYALAKAILSVRFLERNRAKSSGDLPAYFLSLLPDIGLESQGIVGYVYDSYRVDTLGVYEDRKENYSHYVLTAQSKDDRAIFYVPIVSKFETVPVQVFRDSHGYYAYLTNPKTDLLIGLGFEKETGDSRLRLLASSVDGSVPVYFHTHLAQTLFSERRRGGGKRSNQNFESAIDRRYYTPVSAEGNFRETEDQLEFKNDYESLATVIALKEVKPPIAIGLFGNWGSGKSFFMEKLNDTLLDLAKSKEDRFVEYIVPVKFNSWHYSDANLWASIITEIFDSLSTYSRSEGKDDELRRLSNTLQITKIQKEAVESKRQVLSDQVRALEAERRRKREQLEDLSGINFLRLISSDPMVKEDLSRFDNEPIQAILTNKDQLQSYVDDLKLYTYKFKSYLKIVNGFDSKRWAVAFLIMCCVAVVTLLISHFAEIQETWDWFSTWAATITTSVVAFVGTLYKNAEPIRRGLNEAYDRLKSLTDTINNRPVIESPEILAGVKEIEMLQRTLDDLDEKIKGTEQELADIKSGKRLVEFLEQRSREENYSRQLGIISWIRKDFNKLDELLRKQHDLSVSQEEKDKLDNPQQVKLKIDRIVLYIDDLDRCNEDTVVKVLEAIHLLLAFPLFVVIVGVDPRWLNNALTKRYRGLFARAATKAANMETRMNRGDSQETVSVDEILGAATTHDYLEKIFQIPFSLKPLNKAGRENLLRYLTRNEMAKETQKAPSVRKDISRQEQLPVGERDAGDDNATPQTDSRTTAKPPMNPEKKIATVRVRFKQEEIEYMQSISPLFAHTPRGVNRYVNIYRIIKAHQNLKVSRRYNLEDYGPVMIMLSVIVGHSNLAGDFFNTLSSAKQGQTFEDFLRDDTLPKGLADLLKSHVVEEILACPVQIFQQNLDLVCRFSFRK
ncbi:MAG: P-loop NTPase fold protein [Chryseolinea sp.]